MYFRWTYDFLFYHYLLNVKRKEETLLLESTVTLYNLCIASTIVKSANLKKGVLCCEQLLEIGPGWVRFPHFVGKFYF